MWPWKKRKPDEDKKPGTDNTPPDLIVLTGIVAPPPPRGERAPEPQPNGDEKDEGTSRAARAVSARMSHTNSPRAAFDPSKAKGIIPLVSVEIATPCRADWSKMQGDDKTRFCGTCAKNVYNLSAMTSDEAQALIAEKDGDLCARIYRRADGTMITSDCTVGQSMPRRPFWGAFAGLLAAIGCGGLLGGCGTSTSGANTSPAATTRQADLVEKMRGKPVVGAVVNKLWPAMMGDIAVMPTTTKGQAVCPPGLKPAPSTSPATSEHVKPRPLMGRIARPRPTATPKPTASPSGEADMGAIAPPRAEA